MYEGEVDPVAAKRILKLADKERRRRIYEKFEEIVAKGDDFPHVGLRKHPRLARFAVDNLRVYYGRLPARNKMVLLGADPKNSAYSNLERLEIILDRYDH